MEITHYFLDKGYNTKPKNNLHKEFAEYLRSLHGMIIPASKLELMKYNILAKARYLNEKHSRCFPLELNFWNSSEGHEYISGFYCQEFRIMPGTLNVMEE